MTPPLVSVIVPIYKVEAYLRRCLNSIVNQTYTNLEIILVDDGSPDACPQICDEFAAKDKHIIVIHKTNGGLSDARNNGTKRATGEYIFYLDADDELPQNAISLLIEQVFSHPSTEIVIGEMQSIPYTKEYDTFYLNSIDYISNNNWIRKNFYRVHNRLPVNACNKLIRKDFIVKNHFFFEPGLIHEDELWMFFVAQKLSKVVFVHQTTYIRYINPHSITTATSSSKKAEAWNQILSHIFPSITEPYSIEQFFTYLSFWMKHCSHYKKKENKKNNWQNIILFTKKHHLFFLRTLLNLYKISFPFLKGHGIGFCIWLYSKKITKI